MMKWLEMSCSNPYGGGFIMNGRCVLLFCNFHSVPVGSDDQQTIGKCRPDTSRRQQR